MQLECNMQTRANKCRHEKIDNMQYEKVGYEK